MAFFRTKMYTAVALVGLMLSASAQAHEFILKPDTATPAAGQKPASRHRPPTCSW